MNTPSYEPANRFAKNRFLIVSTMLIFLTLGLDFLAGTVFLQVRGYPYSSTLLAPYPWETPRDAQIKELKEDAKQYRVPVPSHHHDLKPLASWEGSWGPIRYSTKTNSLGFRDTAAREVPLKADKTRIVFLGDSFTEGVGVEYEETFVGIIDRSLAGQGIEVLNAGVISYSPVVYFHKTKHLLSDVGLRFDELAVFIDISDAYDEVHRYKIDEAGAIKDGKPKSLSSSGVGFAGFAKKYSVLTFLLTHIPELRQRSYPITGDPRALWTFDERWFQDYGKLGLKKMGKSMTELKELCDAEGVRLTVAIYPYPDQVVDGKLEDYHQSFWAKWCQEHGVGFLDLYPTFFNEGASLEARRASAKANFFARDTHWNKNGHQLVADSFLQWWKEFQSDELKIDNR